MVDIKGFNGGLNQDAADELMPSGDYKYAMNIQNGSSGITKLPGTNTIAPISATPSGSNWVCGSHFDKNRQIVIYFIFNSDGYHRIVSVNVANNTSTILFEDKTNTGGTSIFGWGSDVSLNPEKLIKDIRIIYRDIGGDLVYFIDPLKRPLKFNINTLPVLSASNNVLLDYFNVIKTPPPAHPYNEDYIDVPNRNVNNVRGKLFQFKVRWVYDDDEKSVWSAISKIPIQPSATDGEYYADGTRANGIVIDILTGSKLVKKIEIAGRICIGTVWGSFFLIDTLDKQKLSIPNDSAYTYQFLNDAAYVPIEVSESNLLFDYVPDEANAMELANGNTLVYGGIKEGLDRLSNFDVTATLVQQPPSNLPGALAATTWPDEVIVPVQISGTQQAEVSEKYTIRFDGTPQVGDVVNVRIIIGSIETDFNFPPAFVNAFDWVYDNPPDSSVYIDFTRTYTVGAGPETLSSLGSRIAGDLATYANSGIGKFEYKVETHYSQGPAQYYIVLSVLGVGGAYTYFKASNSTYPHDVNDGVSVSVNSSPPITEDTKVGLKYLGRYKYGLVYYNKNGKTNGVYIGSNKNLTIDLPKYSEDANLVPQMYTTRISINHAPPAWATYYHLVRTKELTSVFSKYLLTNNSHDFSEAQNSSPYLYINIQNISNHLTNFPTTANSIDYTEATFAKGDRIRVIKNYTNGVVFNTHVDVEILGLVKKNNILYIKIDYYPNIMFNVFTSSSAVYLVEIYRPAKSAQSDDITFYYEFGEVFDIVTDINGNKAHGSWSGQNQIIGASAQPAILNSSDGDYYFKTRKLTSANDGIIPYYCLDQNLFDNYESQVWNSGRALVIDESARTQYFPSLLRYSRSYIQGTNINNTCRFFPENFEEADNSFGDILRLKTRENFIRVFQRNKVSMAPIYRSLITDSGNSTQIALSEKLLNKPNYYAGEYGIDKYGSSLVSTDYGDYFIDTLNKSIIRVSLDGITNISDTFNVSNFANSNIEESSYGYGYFDYERRTVVMLIGGVSRPVTKIISYIEPDKKFESEYGFTAAQSFLFVNGFAWSFVGRPYIHNDTINRNRFYGVQQNANINLVHNGNVSVKKTYTAFELLATELWTSVINTGPLLAQETDLDVSDFTKSSGAFVTQIKESKYNTTIKRDKNSSGGKYLGESMKGCFAEVKLTNNTPLDTRLISVSLKYITSPLTNS